MSEMLTDPTEVREHLTNTLAEVAGEDITHDFPPIFWDAHFELQNAEFVVPRKEQRFRKRDRFYFHSRRFVRQVRNLNYNHFYKWEMKSSSAI